MNLLSIITKDRANILTVDHDNLVTGLDPNETSVHIACEVGGKEHAKQLIRDIREGGYVVENEE